MADMTIKEMLAYFEKRRREGEEFDRKVDAMLDEIKARREKNHGQNNLAA